MYTGRYYMTVAMLNGQDRQTPERLRDELPRSSAAIENMDGTLAPLLRSGPTSILGEGGVASYGTGMLGAAQVLETLGYAPVNMGEIRRLAASTASGAAYNKINFFSTMMHKMMLAGDIFSAESMGFTIASLPPESRRFDICRRFPTIKDLEETYDRLHRFNATPLSVPPRPHEIDERVKILGELHNGCKEWIGEIIWELGGEANYKAALSYAVEGLRELGAQHKSLDELDRYIRTDRIALAY